MQLVIPQVNRLKDVRHDATNKALRAAARRRRITARYWARIVVLIDRVIQHPHATTMDEWERVIESYAEAAK